MTTALALLDTRDVDLHHVNLRERRDHKRAHAIRSRLIWSVLAMVVLNGVVWGGAFAATRGLIDIKQIADQAWAWGSAWAAVANGTLDPASW